jgi:DNA-directed RNA polymerase subunit RPC12/RpoP
MTLNDAIRILDETIPLPGNKMVDAAHLNIAVAWQEIKADLSEREPTRSDNPILTENEALHLMRHDCVTLTARPPSGLDEADLTAIWVHALGAMYRACEQAVIIEADDENGTPYEFINYRCPNCGNIITQERQGQKENLYRPKYCQDCGQRLAWSKTHGES